MTAQNSVPFVDNTTTPLSVGHIFQFASLKKENPSHRKPIIEASHLATLMMRRRQPPVPACGQSTANSSLSTASSGIAHSAISHFPRSNTTRQ